MASIRVEGNLKNLPTAHRGRRNLPAALRSWTIGGVGEALAIWALHKAGFGRVVKPVLLQGAPGGDALVFISPNQLRQGLCWVSHSTDRQTRENLSEEQVKLAFRWDFLAVKDKVPCLVEVKTQSGAEPSDYYRLFKKRDFSKEKQAGFRVFCLKVALKEDWDFEALFEEL